MSVWESEAQGIVDSIDKKRLDRTQPFERLEHEWARFNDLDPAGMVACSSGTAALHLALEAFQLPPGSEVIVPDFTMVACPRAIVMAGLTPVFVDCKDDLLMDANLVVNAMFDCRTVEDARYVSGKVPAIRAIMDVSVYGRNGDEWRKLHIGDVPIGTFNIEDLAEAHGIRPQKSTDAACWSFYKNKIVAGEEGGAVWFRDPSHARFARQLRSLGFTDAHDYNHVPRGHNYRMSNAHANLILPAFEMCANGVNVATNNMEIRRKIERWYDEFCPAEWRQPARDAVWVYDFRIPGLDERRPYECEPLQDEIVRKLRMNGIEARHGFKPMHAQKEFESCRRVGGENAERASREVIYLPVQPGVTTRADAERAFELVRSIVPRT